MTPDQMLAKLDFVRVVLWPPASIDRAAPSHELEVNGRRLRRRRNAKDTFGFGGQLEWVVVLGVTRLARRRDRLANAAALESIAKLCYRDAESPPKPKAEIAELEGRVVQDQSGRLRLGHFDQARRNRLEAEAKNAHECHRPTTRISPSATPAS